MYSASKMKEGAFASCDALHGTEPSGIYTSRSQRSRRNCFRNVRLGLPWLRNDWAQFWDSDLFVRLIFSLRFADAVGTSGGAFHVLMQHWRCQALRPGAGTAGLGHNGYARCIVFDRRQTKIETPREATSLFMVF